MLINVSLLRPSACISMTIHESDSCKEIVHWLRIYLTLSLISAQYTLEFSSEMRCSTLKCPTHKKPQTVIQHPGTSWKMQVFTWDGFGCKHSLMNFSSLFHMFSPISLVNSCSSQKQITICSVLIITVVETTVCFLFGKQVRNSIYFIASWDHSN